MGKAGSAAVKRTVSGRQGQSRKRRPIADRAGGIDPAANLPTSGPVVADAASKGLEDAKLGEANNPVGTTTTRYLGLRLKAELALEKLLDEPAAPANVRASAARTLLELVGAIGVKAKREGDQDLNDLSLEPETMTLQDIDRELLRLGEV
jgi:hypothetical protein